jgi:Flp pilus assembly protein TadG
MTRHRMRDERGSITVFYLIAALGMAAIIGLAIDLGGMVYAKQHVLDVATQAARAGGEAVVAAPAMRGLPVSIDAGTGRQAALAYLAGAGMTGTVTLTATTIEVTATTAWQPVILGQFGFAGHDFTGTASARLVRAVNGTER